MGSGQFDEAKECYKSLRELGENSAADKNLAKLHDAQEKDILHRLTAKIIKIWIVLDLRDGKK